MASISEHTTMNGICSFVLKYCCKYISPIKIAVTRLLLGLISHKMQERKYPHIIIPFNKRICRRFPLWRYVWDPPQPNEYVAWDVQLCYLCTWKWEQRKSKRGIKLMIEKDWSSETWSSINSFVKALIIDWAVSVCNWNKWSRARGASSVIQIKQHGPGSAYLPVKFVHFQ